MKTEKLIELEDLLIQLSDYMENRADADSEYINEEMNFLVRIDELLSYIENLKKNIHYVPPLWNRI